MEEMNNTNPAGGDTQAAPPSGDNRAPDSLSRWVKPALVIITLAALIGLLVKFGARSGAMSSGGKAAPEVMFKDLDGKDVTLASLRGKVVLVNFWATWCEPCRGEIPWLIELQDKYAARGFTVLGVAMDEEGSKVVAPFVEKQRFDVNGTPTAMNYPNVIGNDDIAGKFGGLIGLPTSHLISRDGRILRSYVGPIELSEVEKVIEGQL